MAMRPVPAMYDTTQTYRENATQFNYGTYHGALDFGVPEGTPIVAPEDGVIAHAGFAWDLPGGPNDWAVRDYQIKPARGDLRTGGGIMVKLVNDIGSRWWSAHLSRTDLNVGDRVRKGQIIGYSGNTGSSTGPHLHQALIPPAPNWANGAYGGIDPAPYLTEAYAPLSAVSWQGAPTAGVGSTTRDTILDFIDASEHNTVDSVKKVPTDAIILRTGWGIGGDDKLFDQHLTTARDRKLRIGTYHYAYLHRNDPRAEARYYASRIPADAEFACLDYEDGIKSAADVKPEKVAAFADEFRKHSTVRLDLYTWAWAAERIDPTPFGGRLWLPDFGANPVFKNYVGVVEVPQVKGWTVIANQYGDRFQPATGGKFDINKHLGGMWATRTTASTTPKDWFTMADKNTLKAALREVLAEKAVQDRLVNAVLDARIDVQGSDPDGKPYKGHTSLRQEASWGTFRGFRDRRIEATGNAIAEAVRPSTLQAVLPGGPNITATELAHALLHEITNPTTEGA